MIAARLANRRRAIPHTQRAASHQGGEPIYQLLVQSRQVIDASVRRWV